MAAMGSPSPAGATASRLYPHYESDAGRWLWIAGLSGGDLSKLEELVESHRPRETKASAVSIQRHAGHGVWVRFSAPAFAQACLVGLNGTASGSGGVVRVRYAHVKEDTSQPPQVRYAKRAPDAAIGARGAGAPSAANARREQSPSGQRPTKIEGKDDDGAADGGGNNSKRAKHDDAAPSPSAAPLPLRPPNGNVPNGVPAAGLASGGAASTGPALWEGGPGTNADVLRLALRCMHAPRSLALLISRARILSLVGKAARRDSHSVMATRWRDGNTMA
jgi:hypothetical protein